MKIFKEFEGKTAFVTGAASGMGQAVAICFGGLGCRVAVAARNPKALETVQTIRENGGEAIFVECDVTDDDSVRKAIETTVKTFGSLDYAFNNAGCGADGKNIPFAPLTEVAESDWQKVINTNLTGVFHCMKYELLQMQKQGRGAIVNNASIGGLRMAPGFGAYLLIKGRSNRHYPDGSSGKCRQRYPCQCDLSGPDGRNRTHAGQY